MVPDVIWEGGGGGRVAGRGKGEKGRGNGEVCEDGAEREREGTEAMIRRG